MRSTRWSTARRASLLAATAALAACATDTTTAPARSPVLPDAGSLSFQEGTPTGAYLVRAQSSGAVSTARTSIASAGGTVVRDIPSMNLYYVSGLSASGAASLASQPGLTVVEDRLVQWVPNPGSLTRTFVSVSRGPSATGTDQSGAFFYATYQWSLKVTGADRTWVPSNGGAGETVCVLDTGVDAGHSDLNGLVDPAKLMTVILVPRFASDATPVDYHFHGTFVSAQIRSNGLGTASVAPNATLCSIKVLSEDGSGTFGDIIFGIVRAAGLGASVINMSLGGYIQESNPANAPFLAFLQEAIDVARGRGAVVVAASGNDGFNMDDVRQLLGFINIPAQMNNVLSVGATGPFNQMNFDALTAYSNYGGKSGADLVAPGGNGGLPGGVTADYILSACSRFAFGGAVCGGGNTYLFGNGTSFAAPIVAGAAAVLHSNQPAWSPGLVEQCILNNADYVGPGWKYGRGRLNVRRASLCSGK
jgi:lantibiotic leader peptide-processing serine protease